VIRKLTIANFKSINSIVIPVSRFTVVIGENGAGKSNILEALVMASAASKGKLDRELLIGRGVRVSSPQLMRSAFISATKDKPILISILYDAGSDITEEVNFSLTHDGEPYSDWKVSNKESEVLGERFKKLIRKKIELLPDVQRESELSIFKKDADSFMALLGDAALTAKVANESSQNNFFNKLKSMKMQSAILATLIRDFAQKIDIDKFTVYSPDYYTLRNFVSEGQTAPLGTRGEGLLKLLATMQKKEPERLKIINEGLKILGWYKEIDLTALSTTSIENRILVKDRFIKRRGIFLDQVSTNEGFLFCLFYLVLFTSSDTPRAFGIENIENGLNPKLCEALVKTLRLLGVQYGKQAIISTHSPAVLDALDLDDSDNILIAVDRNLDGHTRVNVIKKPRNTKGKTTRLSELFLKGLLGGVPRNFL
jgi:energy-coupling factor transporter ATP-binding protein EcfA2